MWNVPHLSEWLLYGLTPLVVIAFVAGVVWRARKWALGVAEPASPSAIERLKQLIQPRVLVDFIKNAFFQWRLVPDSFSSWMHLTIFWGMVLLFLGTAIATVDQDFLNLPFDWQLLQGNIYRLFELVLDLAGVALLVGLALAAYRRYVVKPERLGPNRRAVTRWDNFPFLGILAAIAISGFLVEGLRLAEGFRLEAQLRQVAAAEGSGSGLVAERKEILHRWGYEENLRHLGTERQEAELERVSQRAVVFPAAPWAPVGYGLGKIFAAIPEGVIRTLHQLLWWAHALLAFGFIVAVPFTKAFHLISSPISILYRNTGPVGRLPVVSESGAQTIRQLTWRQLLQADACTWCGKCQEVCPGYNCGYALSPKVLVQSVDYVLLRTPWKGNGQAGNLHEVISPDELWACCTCRACEEICPVCVEHPRLVIDMRRSLIDQGKVEEGVQDALMNFQRYGNSFGQSPRKRSTWVKTLDFPIKDALKEPVEYLWFTGDYAAYDQRVVEVTKKLAQVLHHLAVDFGLLMDKEQNAGNDVRRIGEEGLFDMLRQKNLEQLGKAHFAAVFTTDPHTYNALKNEYEISDGEGNGSGTGPLAGKPVLHYTELLDRWLQEGKLVPSEKLQGVATYHDPCYLGRYNGIYEAPRRVIEALGLKLVEMPRNRRNSFCCGAGGGRVWMKDIPGIERRPAELRVHEALALPGVQRLVVACPKDLVMFQDAVKTIGAEDRLQVVDIAELVWQAVGSPVTA